MFNKKAFLLLFCLASCLAIENCFAMGMAEDRPNLANMGCFVVAAVGSLYAGKVLNKSEYCKNVWASKLRTFIVTLGGVRLAIFIMSILNKCFGNEMGNLSKEERSLKRLLLFSIIVSLNYFVDKILNGNEYYHTKIDPCVKDFFITYGSFPVFLVAFDLLKDLLKLEAEANG